MTKNAPIIEVPVQSFFATWDLFFCRFASASFGLRQRSIFLAGHVA